MANLPTLADRLEDLEVGANKPLTESLFRKFGSNINFLLDFLGVSDGETSPSGDIQDLANAINIISNHTMSLEATINGTAGNVNATIGTFNSIKYVNQVIIASCDAAIPQAQRFGNYGIGGGTNWFVTKRADGTGPVTLPANRLNKNPTHSILKNGNYAGAGSIDPTLTTVYNDEKAFGGNDTNYGAIASDFRVPDDGATEWMQVGELDWREANSWLLQAKIANLPFTTINFYIAYQLNIESAGLIF